MQPRGTSASLVVAGKSLIAIKNWTFLLGPGFMDGIGTGLMLGWLMYRSGLVARPVALLGVIGGPLLAISGAAVLLSVIPDGGTVQHVMTVPEVLWEAFLALWVPVIGFRRVGLSAEIVGSRVGAIAPSDAVVAA